MKRRMEGGCELWRGKYAGRNYRGLFQRALQIANLFIGTDVKTGTVCHDNQYKNGDSNWDLQNKKEER
jgi:hypothetical protein